MKKLLDNHYLLIIILLGIIVIYFPLFNGFYQQDEWGTLGRYFLKASGLKDTFFEIFELSTGHYVPFTRLFLKLGIASFGLNYIGYVWLSLLLHMFVVVLLYIFSTKLLNDKLLALITTSLFAFNASIFQATTWIIVNISVHGATIFGLLCLISFYKFIEDHKSRDFWLSIIFLFISLMFKEVTIGLFGLLPLMYYLFNDFQVDKDVIKYPLIVIFSGVLFVLFRFYLIATTTTISSHGLGVEQSNSELFINLITFPASVLSQSIFYIQKLIILGKDIFPILPFTGSIKPNTTQYNLFIEKEFVLGFSIIFFLLITAFLIYYWRQDKKDRYTKLALFGFLFVILNGFIYALSPGRQGIITIMDSRNLYFPAVGTSILITSTLMNVLKNDKEKQLLIVVPFIILNAIWLNNKVESLSATGIERKNILYKIRSQYPSLPDKVVFYTESDSPYYGLPNSEKILPFQSGFGQTLLVWYSKNENLSNEFYDNFFLWDIKEQGYMEVDNRGFGYYREMDELKTAYQDNDLDPENIIAFSWTRKDKKLEDITPQVRDLLEQLDSEQVEK